MFAFRPPEHDGKDGSSCCYPLVDLATLLHTKSLLACPSDPNGTLAIKADTVRIDVVLELSPHTMFLQRTVILSNHLRDAFLNSYVILQTFLYFMIIIYDRSSVKNPGIGG